MAAFGDFHPVSGAGWSVSWRISQLYGSGLEVWFADFKGRRVMFRGTQPIAIVPYHRPIAGEPKPPHYTFKDGIGPQWGGATFDALKKTAPNTWAWWDLAAVDTEAVEVHVEPASNFGPAHLTISAKFQCGWYQYVHRWEFDSDGNIHASVAMGGQLNPHDLSKAHAHHMYFRLDLDIDGSSRDIFEEFEHQSYNDPGGDGWVTVATQGKRLAAPEKSRKWRVRDAASVSSPGEFRGYEIEIPQLGGRDAYSTGDIWVTVYRGDSVEQGDDVGVTAPTDDVLSSVYCAGPLDTVNGNDIVLWVAIHTHHEPRHKAEEANHLPYHYAEFSITPRTFTAPYIVLTTVATVAVAPLSDKRLQLWATEGTGLYSTWKTTTNPNASWTKWADFFGEVGSLPGGTPQVGVAPLSDGRLQLWAVTTSGGLYSTWKTTTNPNASWGPWADFIAEVGGLPAGAKQVAVAPLPDKRLHLWVVTADGGLFTTWKTTTNPNATWVPWADFLAEVGGLPGGTQQVAVAPLSDGRLQLWAITTSGDLFSTWKTTTNPNATWVPWADFLAEVGGLPAGAKQAAVAPLSDKRLQLWVVTEDGGLFSTWKTTTNPNATWVPWADFLVEVGGLPGGTQQVTVAPLSDGRLQLWAITTGGGLFSTWKTTTNPNATWVPWADFLVELS